MSEALGTIGFDGHGRPVPQDVETGVVLLLVQGDEVSVVRLEILPPVENGPCLHHASNSDELEADARAAIREVYPEWLSRDRHWTLECPDAIAQRARFPRGHLH